MKFKFNYHQLFQIQNNHCFGIRLAWTLLINYYQYMNFMNCQHIKSLQQSLIIIIKYFEKHINSEHIKLSKGLSIFIQCEIGLVKQWPINIKFFVNWITNNSLPRSVFKSFQNISTSILFVSKHYYQYWKVFIHYYQNKTKQCVKLMIT